MLFVALLLPLFAAITAWALDRVVPTRHIGYLAISALFVSAVLIIIANPIIGLPIQLLNIEWIKIETYVVLLTLRLDLFTWALSIMVLFIAVAGMIGLIYSLPYQLRNYGSLLALILVHVSIILFGVIAQESVLRVFMWGIAAIIGGILMRVSGALPGSNAPLVSIVGGLSGAILLMVAVLWRNYLPVGALPGALVMAWSFAALLGMGLVPFHSYVAGLSSAPAILTLFLVPLGIPLLGALSFIEMMATQGPLVSDTWRNVLMVLAIISAVGTAVGAVSATRLRSLLGWHASNQYSLIILAAVSDTQVMVLGVPILLLSSLLTTSVIALAVGFIESSSNSDELTQLRPRLPIGVAGVMILVAVAASIGIPGTVGFVARWWMAEILLVRAPWTIIAMLVSGSLLGLAWSVALASIWRRMPRSMTATGMLKSAIPVRGTWIGPIAFGGVLLLFGIFPQYIWSAWLVPLQGRLSGDAALIVPSVPTLFQQIGLVVMALAILVIPIIAGRLQQKAGASADQGAVTIPPQATAESLGVFMNMVQANWLLQSLWGFLIRFGNALQWIFRLGEDRYYVAGVVLGFILVVLLLI
ncbi:MAG: hypothetical protein FJ040_01355 [Chloroflexi bacterium]|nr:hypothetical protein [Chloroflexota bacterium]